VISTVVDTPQSIGPGMQSNTVIPDTIRVRWVIGGSAGQTVTCTMSLIGQPEGQ
jgi:lipid-binding SYLF domain-containing protein